MKLPKGEPCDECFEHVATNESDLIIDAASRGIVAIKPWLMCFARAARRVHGGSAGREIAEALENAGDVVAQVTKRAQERTQ